MKFILALLITLTTLNANAIDLDAEAYYVFHPKTKTVIASKNADTAMGPASLTKMMTTYMLFKAIKDGTVSLESELPVSEKAWRMGGSKMFVEVGKTAKVEDLIKGITVSSGNDACVVIAEYLGGSEEEFAKRMTQQAHRMGMENTIFKNASGWPDPEMHSTAHDMALLGWHLYTDFPEFYHYWSETEFTYSGIKQHNRNGLLTRGVGVDGIKTGHTEESGYHLVSSAERGDVRLFAAVMGTKSMRAREQESLTALNYGFNTYKMVTVVRQGEKIQENVPVRYGEPPFITVVAGEDLNLYMDRDRTKVDKQIEIKQGLTAPLKAGDKVGELSVVTANNGVYTVPLVAARDVQDIGFFSQILWNIAEVLGFE